MEKTGSKTSPISYAKLAKRTPFYRVQKTSRWAQFSGQTGLPVLTDQRSFFRSLWLPVDRPVDRARS